MVAQQRPLPILFVHHRSELGGAPESLSYLIRELDRDRFEPHVYCPPGPAADLFREAGAIVHTGAVAGFPGADSISSEAVLELDVDVLVPAALENQIHRGNANRIKAKLICEGANGPTSPEADEILHDKGVFVIPDILANAGGVTVSYFEWVQDLQEFFWDEHDINERLERIMLRAFDNVLRVSLEKKLMMRTAAYVLAVDKVAQATTIRGIYP